MFSSFGDILKREFEAFVGMMGNGLLGGLLGLLHSIEQSGGQLLLDSATAAVHAMEQTGKPGAEKFADAKTAVIGTLQSAGVTVIENAVNGAIEAAVAAMKIDPVKTAQSAARSAGRAGLQAAPADPVPGS